MARSFILGGFLVAFAASIAGFPLEAREDHQWAGLLFIVFALALFAGSTLFALDLGRHKDDIAAVGFVAVAIYGIGTTLNSSLLARDLPEISVGIQPGIWGALALGMLLIGVSSRFPIWVRLVGALSAVGHVVAASALLFGAEMPPTGGEPTDPAPLILAISKLFFWAALAGWTRNVWKTPANPDGSA